MKQIKSTKISTRDQARWGFQLMASIENPKGRKAREIGYLNAILYMAPASTAGVGNLCPFAGSCAKLCLGEHSGQAAIGAPEKNAAIRARKARAKAYMTDRAAFLAYVVKDVERCARVARKLRMRLCYRFNGSTDVGVPAWLIERFPSVEFIDYTKNPTKIDQYLDGKLPRNYSVTFSRDTHNEWKCDDVLARGGNVAVVFDMPPTSWHGAPVIDGDAHDVRIPALDGRGNVIGLVPKGRKAKRDTSGFVVRAAA